jgi:HAMP domain-containing protein
MGVVLIILLVVILAAIAFVIWNRSRRRGRVLLTHPQRPDERDAGGGSPS